MDHEMNTAIAAAMEAGRMIKASLGEIKEVEYKGRINIVTDVDKRSEAMIIKALGREFPDYGFISEERPPEDRGPACWIIDPLDGTTNFSRGFPFFAVSIGLVRDGQVEIGVVFDPLREELFTARAGRGAFLNSQPIKVSAVDELEKSFLSTGFSYKFKEQKKNNLDNFSRFMMASMAVRRAGSACLDLCYVACGRFDGFWELDLFPWDTAAAMRIVSEAGGRVSDFRGEPFDIFGNSILASNKLLHADMLEILGEE